MTEPSKEKEMIGVIAGLAAFLVLFILIAILALVLTIRRYRAPTPCPHIPLVPTSPLTIPIPAATRGS